jgi:hypothetical protein
MNLHSEYNPDQQTENITYLLNVPYLMQITSSEIYQLLDDLGNPDLFNYLSQNINLDDPDNSPDTHSVKNIVFKFRSEPNITYKMSYQDIKYLILKQLQVLDKVILVSYLNQSSNTVSESSEEFLELSDDLKPFIAKLEKSAVDVTYWVADEIFVQKYREFTENEWVDYFLKIYTSELTDVFNYLMQYMKSLWMNGGMLSRIRGENYTSDPNKDHASFYLRCTLTEFIEHCSLDQNVSLESKTAQCAFVVNFLTAINDTQIHRDVISAFERFVKQKQIIDLENKIYTVKRIQQILAEQLLSMPLDPTVHFHMIRTEFMPLLHDYPERLTNPNELEVGDQIIALIRTNFKVSSQGMQPSVEDRYQIFRGKISKIIHKEDQITVSISSGKPLERLGMYANFQIPEENMVGIIFRQ